MNENQIKICKDLFNLGWSQKKIAREIGTSQASISRLTQKLSLQRDNLNKNISDKLISNLYLGGLSGHRIAKQLNISNQAIYERLNRIGITKTINYKDIAEQNRKFYVDYSMFNPLTQIGSYYLGLLYADGSLYAKNKTPNVISLALNNKDSDIIHQFKQDIKYNGKLTPFEDAQRIAISNITLAARLCQLGMKPGENYKRTIPILESKNRPHFVRGFLDGDGSICYNKARNTMVINFAITYKSFAKSLISLIEDEINIKLNGPYRSKSIWVVQCSHRKARSLAKWIWNNPVRCFSRKHNKYRNLLKDYELTC